MTAPPAGAYRSVTRAAACTRSRAGGGGTDGSVKVRLKEECSAALLLKYTGCVHVHVHVKVIIVLLPFTSCFILKVVSLCFLHSVQVRPVSRTFLPMNPK